MELLAIPTGSIDMNSFVEETEKGMGNINQPSDNLDVV